MKAYERFFIILVHVFHKIYHFDGILEVNKKTEKCSVRKPFSEVFFYHNF